MFYPVDSLKRGGRFYLCWVADSWPMRFAAITHRQLWSQDICRLCDDLMEVMNNESGRPTSRFSLRLSSQLMRGLVRLYEKKVSVFLGDLCMLNAHIFKDVNKKFVVSVSPVRRPVPHPLPLPRPELPQEPTERVEEMIQNSGNVVANIQDITLKEAVIPEIQPSNVLDNFGEENPDQALQHLLASTTVEQMLLHEEPVVDRTLDPTIRPPEEPMADRTVEQMLHATDASVVQHSGLDLEADKSDKSHLSADKSRVVPDRRINRMSEVSEHDATIHRKSTAPEEKEVEFEKDMPLVPPPAVPVSPVPPAPAPIVVTDPEVSAPMEEQAPAPIQPAPVPQPPELVDIELEELEQQQLIRRRRPRRLAIDKRIKLSDAYLRARIGNIHVELRSEDSYDDIADLRVPFDLLARRPAHAGHRLRPTGSRALLQLFQRRLATEPRDYRRDEQLSEPEPIRRWATRSLQNGPQPETALQNVPEAVEEAPRSEPPALVPADGDQTHLNASINVPDLNVTEVIPNLEVSVPQIDQQTAVEPMEIQEPRAIEEQPVDISMLPTQVLQPLPALETSLKRPSQQDRSSKRHRPGGMQSFRTSLLVEIEANAAEREKENIPPGDALPFPPSPAARPLSVAAMLHEAGLADIPPLREAAEQAHESQSQLTRSRRVTGAGDGDGDSGTPLGSLDRTKVSLGDSVATTDTQRFLRQQWGIEGTMVKIMRMVRDKAAPVTVHALISRGPVLHATKGIIAARCFSSVLKLKQNRFIRIAKDPVTLDIKDITLGPRFDDLHLNFN